MKKYIIDNMCLKILIFIICNFYFFNFNTLIIKYFLQQMSQSKQPSQTQNHAHYQSRQLHHNYQGHNNHGHRNRGRGRTHYRRQFDRVRHTESTPR